MRCRVDGKAECDTAHEPDTSPLMMHNGMSLVDWVRWYRLRHPAPAVRVALTRWQRVRAWLRYRSASWPMARMVCR